MRSLSGEHHIEEHHESHGLARLASDRSIVEYDAAFQQLIGMDVFEGKAIGDEQWPSHLWVEAMQDPAAVAFACGASNVVVRIGAELRGERTILVHQPPPPGSPSLDNDALSDPLTGLGNRRRLEQLLDQSQHSEPLTLLLIDLDRFKQVNDTLGHGAGDQLLAMAADRIVAATRAGDQVIRLGGDEFVIMIDGDLDAATTIATRTVEFLARPFLLNGQQANVGASIGIAPLDESTTASDLLRHADLALYAAKAAGRGRLHVFEPGLERTANSKRQLEISLRRALTLGELSIVYQPQVALPAGNVTGFEALLRWNNPHLGTVSPATFIPVAEEIGEIVRIGAWVLQQACAEAVGWPDQLGVAVNVSAVQLDEPDFVEQVGQTLQRSGLEPHRLELEITESVLLRNTEVALRRLNGIRDLGVEIAMDDFGTGYSSLSTLSKFPFSSIKIDQSFVHDDDSDRASSLVRAIVALGASLGMTTIAEGVETTEQSNQLTEQGCTEAQGYLFSRPIPPSEISAFLIEQSRTEQKPSKSPTPPTATQGSFS